MILIAESGSTKTDWVLVDDENQITMYKTMGFNPFFHSSEFIAGKIKKKVKIFIKLQKCRKIVFLWSRLF